MNTKRLSGVLVHPTSFPSPYGIGDLGKGAYDFIDFLEKGDQKLWQILPLGPTSFGDSPYQSFSTFAGNYLLISPEVLVEQGYLTNEDLYNEENFNPLRVDYGKVIDYKNKIFMKAFLNFKINPHKQFKNFCKKNKHWLDDYVLFISLKNYFINQRLNNFSKKEYEEFKNKYSDVLTEKTINDYYYGAVWSTWPEKLVTRDKQEVSKYTKKLETEIEYQKFLQFEFFRQWQLVKEYANEREIQIIGDIPIFVAYDSCDVWADKDLFMLDSNFFPTKVAGVPPDYFSEKGQLWGNPLYDWKKNEKTGFNWWINRIKSSLGSMDILRIDHFRGFDTYWEVPFGNEYAVDGKWKNGPGKKLFDAIIKELGELPIIAEDLGSVSEGTEQLRRSLNFPGMKILQFAFGSDEGNFYLPHNYEDCNTVVYTGTHDNDTTKGWYYTTNSEAQDYYRRYLNVSGDDVAWDLIRLALSSIAKYAVVPIQDIMSLDSNFRMNTPGSASGNWQFRYEEHMLLEDYAKRILYLSNLYKRN